jgi:hypothetical protein
MNYLCKNGSSPHRMFYIDPEKLIESSMEAFSTTILCSGLNVEPLKADMRKFWNHLASKFDGKPSIETVPRQILGGFVTSAAHTRY